MSLIQTGHMMMLVAILFSVAPGLPIDLATILAITLVGIFMYLVDALGGVYEWAVAVREARA